jgi:acetoin utilization deacetylase AcuC-like enzyme
MNKIKVVCISAGFDTFEKDPLTPISLDQDAYFKIGKRIKELGLPVFCILEGGYSSYIGKSINNLIQGLEST